MGSAHRTIAAVLIASSLVVACGGSVDSAEAKSKTRATPDLCAAITPGDAERALGSPIVTRRPDLAGDSVTCEYRPVGAMDTTIVLTATVQRYRSAAAAKSAFEKAVQDADVRRVPGIGDGVAVVGTTAPDVVERDGNLVYRFSLGSVGDQGRADRLLQLARDVVART